MIFCGQRLHCKIINNYRKTKTGELSNMSSVTSLENMLDFEFTIYMPWQMFLLFFESLVTLTLNVDGHRRYTTLWRAGTTVKVTMISFKTIPELFPVLSWVRNKSIITMILKSSNIAITVSLRKCMEIA